MDDLIAWLRVQLDEDERVARALDGEGWSAHEPAHGMRRVTVNYSTEYVVACTLSARGEHIALHDPARVLRDVEAKRKILALTGFGAQFPDFDGGYESACEDVIKLLALPYSDRPGYRQEWAPPDA